MIAALQERPHVVATVTQPDDLPLLASHEPVAADILEFRLDNLLEVLTETQQTIESIATPALATARSSEEGGANNVNEAQRLDLYRSILPAARLVDTEIGSLATAPFEHFVTEAHQADALVVASYHDFHSFPGIDLIEAKIDSAFRLNADIAKVAVYLENLADLSAFASLVERYTRSGRLVSAMGMGPMGKLSRLLLAKAGSCLNYGYLQTPNAPGQWSAEELKRLIGEL